VPQGRETQIAGYATARMTPAGFDGTSYDLPLPIRVRDRFFSLLVPGVQTIAQQITGEADTLEAQLRSLAITAVGQMDYDTALSQILRFASVPETELDGVFARLSRQLFGWFVQADPYKAHLRRTLDIFEAPGSQPMLSVLGPVANYILDSGTVCRELDMTLATRLIAHHNMLAALASRSDLPRILRDVRPDIAVSLYDGLLSRDVSAETAQGLAASARELFGRIELSGMAAMLNRQLSLPASLIKTQLLTELVLLIYQAGLPVSRRHG
jgi:hypothetical protein